MKKSILAAGALSLAVSFAFGTMASAGSVETPPSDPVVAEPIGGLSAPAVAGGGVLLALSLA